MPKEIGLTCNCCGAYAGRWKQWFNRDRGYGICKRCAAKQWDEDSDQLMRSCGRPGVHFDGSLIASQAKEEGQWQSMEVDVNGR